MKTKITLLFLLGIMIMLAAAFPAFAEQINILDPDNDGTHHYDEVGKIEALFDMSAGSKYETANGVLWQIWDDVAKTVVPLGSDMDGSDGWDLDMAAFEALGDRASVNLQALVVNRQGGTQSILGVIRTPMLTLSTAPDPTNEDPTPDPDPNNVPEIINVPEIMLVVAKGENSESGIIYANFVGFDFHGADEFVFPIDSVTFEWDDAAILSELSQARADIDELGNVIADLKASIEALQSSQGAPATDPSPDPASPINPNTATLAELDTLYRVGESLAQQIIDDREANGPYTEAIDLARVSGISAGMVARWVEDGVLTFEPIDAP